VRSSASACSCTVAALGGQELLESEMGYSNAIEEAIEGAKTSYQPAIAAGLHWEDVNEGDELPSIRHGRST
jgi:hypothetical protein